MKIRWLIPIAGTVEGQEGVKPGDIMEVPDFNGKRYIANGYAEEVGKKVEHATVSTPAENAAFAENQAPKRTEPIVGAGGDMGGEAEVEPEPKKTPVKRTPRTPRTPRRK